MWGIFWSICWKSLLTWLVGIFALDVCGFVQTVLSDVDYEETTIYGFTVLWVIIGIIACILAFVSLITLIIISIWN